ncbi:MAG: tetratricopeptide repeat protein, partial [Elusimicrobiaceae bacterium]
YRKVIYDSGRKTTPELDTIMQLRNLGAQGDAGQSGAALLGELDSLGKKYPDVEFPKILKARVFYLKKDYPAAEKVLSTVLAGNPNSVPGNSGMAAILGAKGNISGAELLLKRVTDADPHNKEVQQNMEIIKRGSQSQ